MSPELFAQIEISKHSAPARVFPVQNELGEKLWIKLAVKPKNKFWHRVQKIAALLLKRDILNPTVCQGGIEALKAEAKHLKALNTRGFLVPLALYFGPDWMALSDIGNSLPHAPEPLEKTLCLAARELAHLHKANGWHGNAVARNFVIDAKYNLGMIDFEEELENIMPLEARQARDIILFLSSAVSLAENKMPEITMAYLNEEPPLIIASEIAKILKLLSPVLSLLRIWNKNLGRDLRRILQVETYLHQISVYKGNKNA